MTIDLSRISPYDVVARNDRRFDGQFYAAVRTTGIFCRPGCPAGARAENVRFFATAAAAAESGYRPCLRCHPELAPDPPEWQHASPVVSRALRLIGEGMLDEYGIDELARRLHISCRQLQRLFVEELGAPPVAVAQTRRLLFAKKLIDETNLSMADIAFSAGYSSVRRFNEAIRQTYARTPTELRRQRRRSLADPCGTTIDLKLFYREPYDWHTMLAFLKRQATPLVEALDGQTYRRAVWFDGVSGVIVVEPLPNQPAMRLSVPYNLARSLLPITERVKQLFDLKADPLAIADALHDDPELARLIESAPGRRIPGCWDGFEVVVCALLVAGDPDQAQSLLRALITSVGEPLPESNDPAISHRFPTPERLTAALDVSGLSPTLADAIRQLARAVVDGALRFDGVADLDTLRAELHQLPLLDAAAIDRIALRVLGDPDIDLLASERSACWRPWRSYAALYLEAL
jgi:AraC family transcriptional regulator of adaptative response / DNA-3-methyladenine glycosylase II